MAACAETFSPIPQILLQAAQLDGVPLEALVSLEGLEPVSSGSLSSSAGSLEDPPTVQLWDANRLPVRLVGERAAWAMIDAGTAVGLFAAGWTTDHGRNDLPLLGVQLVTTRAVLELSDSCLDHRDAQALAGEFGDAAERRARYKVEAWREITDDLAPLAPRGGMGVENRKAAAAPSAAGSRT